MDKQKDPPKPTPPPPSGPRKIIKDGVRKIVPDRPWPPPPPPKKRTSGSRAG